MSKKNLILPFLETMITQVCNLSCQGCTNYSDLRHSGYVPWSQGRQDLLAWLNRIDIPDFGIMGGEPMINPEWRDWIIGVREILPESQIRFTTNGSLLYRAPDIMDILRSVGNIVFKITVHVRSQKIEESISDIMRSSDWQPVREHGIDRWITDNGVRFQVNRPERFIKTFRGEYPNMRPYHSDPDLAFAMCCQQTCPLLYKGKIFKCSTSGLLADILERFDNPNILEWQPYIAKGISLTDDIEAISRFIGNFGRAASICGQCPGVSESCIDHTKTVWIKKTLFKNKVL